MRQVTVALAACLVASTLAAGQGSDASNGTKSKKSNSEAVEVRLSEMQKAIEVQQQQIQHLVEQVQSRDSQIQELQQQMTQVRGAASQAQQAAGAATSQGTQEEQSITAIRGDVSGLQGTVGNTALALQETQKNVNAALDRRLRQFERFFRSPTSVNT
jgi:chromosome segregation ATPase